MKKGNLFIIIITLILYGINQKVKMYIPFKYLKWFMTCYFNDVIGGMTFTAYCSIVFEYYHKQLKKLWHIELLMFSCGIFWEYITPLFRHNTVSDPYDILAYMLGGLLCWGVQKT